MKKITLMAFALVSTLLSWNAEAQFAEGFEAGIPASWTILNVDGGPQTWTAGTDYPRTGTGNAVVRYESNQHEDLLITPAIAVTAALTDQFSFYAGIQGTFWTEAYEVRLSTTGVAAEDFTVLLDAGTVTNDATVGDYKKYVYNLTPYVGQTVYIAIVATDTDRFYLYIDDAVSDALPTCIAPSALSALVTSATTATLSWTSGGAANAEVLVQLAGTGAPSTADNTGEAASGNTFLVTDLAAATAYEFYVRDECVDGTDLSEWVGPFAFNTTIVPGCATLVAPLEGATNVPTGDVTFEWAAPTTGDPATSYDMYYGLTATDVSLFVGNFTQTSALITLTGFNTTFYWRIVPINAGGASIGCDDTIWSFTTESAPNPPANDECAGAIGLVGGTDFAAAAITTTSAGATYTGTGAPCQGNVGASVWYTVAVPASGTITIETGAASNSSLTDTVIQAFTGSCDALTSVGCNDDGGTGLFSLLSLTGLDPIATPTLYIEVYRYNSTGLGGAFQIAAYDSSLATSSFNNSAFSAYPNPVTDVLNLSYDKNISTVAVFNLLGQQVLSKSINANDAQIDMSQFNSGAYFVKVTSNDQVKTVKVIKQ